MIRKILRFFKYVPYKDYAELFLDNMKLERERDFYKNLCIIDNGKVIKDVITKYDFSCKGNADTALVEIGVADKDQPLTLSISVADIQNNSSPKTTIYLEDQEKSKREKTPFKQKEYNFNLAECFIVDIDGTIAEMNYRGPYEWNKVGTDNPILEIIDLVKSLYAFTNSHLIFLSGRDGSCYSETESWLKKHFPLETFSLYMRSPGDMRKDCIVKEELYNEHIKDKYNVFLVIDDRQQVVDMWRSLGLRCIQVAEGDF